MLPPQRKRVWLGDSVPLSATIEDEDGNPVTPASASWTIKKPDGTDLIVSSLPSTPAVGDVFIAASNFLTYLANNVYQWNGTTWSNISPPSAITALVSNEAQYLVPTVANNLEGTFQARVYFVLSDGSTRSTILDYDVVDPANVSRKVDARALCSIEDVADVLNLDLSDVDETARAARLIEAASEEIYNFTSREFISNNEDPVTGTPSEVRTFELDTYGLGQGIIDVGDMKEAPTAISSYSRDGTLLDTMTLPGDIDLLPRNRKPYQPITMIRIRNHTLSTYSGSYILITSRWGFPKVPENVRNACIETVRLWWDQMAVHSATSEADFTGTAPTRNLPPHVLVSLSMWMDYRG